MTRPAFIEQIREKIGHDQLQLVSVSGVAFNDKGDVLLQHRTDTKMWAVISGVLEPDEQPGQGLEREFLEEAGCHIKILGCASICVEPPQTYANGDIAQFLNLTFLVNTIGSPIVNDEESDDYGWVPVDSIKSRSDVSSQNKRRINDARSYTGITAIYGALA